MGYYYVAKLSILTTNPGPPFFLFHVNVLIFIFLLDQSGVASQPGERIMGHVRHFDVQFVQNLTKKKE